MDFSGGYARRELPDDFGGVTSGAGIFPIGVPTRFHFQMNTHEDGVAGARGVIRQLQLHLRVGGLGQRHGQAEARDGQKYSENSHVDIDALNHQKLEHISHIILHRIPGNPAVFLPAS